MIRGQIVDYSFAGTVDMPDGKGVMRARDAKVIRPAIVLQINDDGTADLYVFCEPWELPSGPVVRNVPSGAAPADAQKARVEDAQAKLQPATFSEVVSK